ncbi:MAG: ClpXP protease specificity-enhancing factor [Pseudomonadota bacterium]
MPAEVPPSSRRPYLLRAMHEWMTDNGQTPHLVVDAAVEGVAVPRQFVRDGKIVLNASYEATSGLLLKNDWIGFGARFGGAPFNIQIPVHAVLGIYARETGQGMIFADEENGPDTPAPTTTPDGPSKATGGNEPPPRRPQLKVVK